MTAPSSRYQASGWQGGRPVSLPLLPGLTTAVPGAQESHLLAPPGPLGPLTLPQWNEDQFGDLKESLSQLCGLLLEAGSPPVVPAEAAAFDSMGKVTPNGSRPPGAQLSLPLGLEDGSGPAPHELPSKTLI